MPIFKGVCTAMITPFKDNEVDKDAFCELIDRQLSANVNAILVCGTTGEPCTMTDDEKLSLIQLAAERINKRVPLIAGVGGNCTGSVATFAKVIRAVGADAILSVTPYYNKCTQEGLVRHYSEIAMATDLPIIVYNVPSRTGFNALPETVEKLSDIPNIVGIKEASPSISQAAEILSVCKGKIDLYTGNDDMIVPTMALGGEGCISVISNIVPQMVVDMTKAVLDGRVFDAAKLQLKLIPLIKATFSEVNPIPVKAAASLLGLCRNELRLPLTPLSLSNTKLMCAELDKLGIIG